MKKQQLLIPVLVLLSALFPATTYALETIDHSSSVFKFQQKLATSGNAQAQYELGYLYETGEGVEADFEKALHWYERAASTGMRPAQQRHEYLMIKELGYDHKQHKKWLDSVIKDASEHKESALLLLGQLYHHGIGVKKDLAKSMDLLTEVASLGGAGVEKEIAAVQAEQDRATAKQRKKQIVKKQAPKQAEKEQVISKQVTVKEKAAAEPGVVEPQKKQTKVSEKKASPVKASQKSEKQLAADLKAEKRRRYEKVMEQLRLEQQLIDEQQAAVTGKELASVDDEI